MPKRQNVRKIPSVFVQGTGSWVEFQRLTYGESKALRVETLAHENDDTDDWAREQSERLLIEKIVGWNWVGNDDQPLPLPSEDVSVLEQLTDEEIEFLTGLFKPGEDTKK